MIPSTSRPSLAPSTPTLLLFGDRWSALVFFVGDSSRFKMPLFASSQAVIVWHRLSTSTRRRRFYLSRSILICSVLSSWPVLRVVFNLPHGEHQMKNTLASMFGPLVKPYLIRGVLSGALYNSTRNRIHTYAVRYKIRSFGPNRVLRSRPPDIHRSEASLTRQAKCLLSQLRSGFSRALKSYTFRIGSSPDALCPECRIATHTTIRLVSSAALLTRRR